MLTPSFDHDDIRVDTEGSTEQGDDLLAGLEALKKLREGENSGR